MICEYGLGCLPTVFLHEDVVALTASFHNVHAGLTVHFRGVHKVPDTFLNKCYLRGAW